MTVISEGGNLARRYEDELAELPDTYQTVRRLSKDDLAEISEMQGVFNSRDSYFIGSGGAVALAHLAAGIHSSQSVHRAQAVTPLSISLRGAAGAVDAAVGLFSARARHPDVRLAARAARAEPGTDVFLLTQLDAGELSPSLAALVNGVVTLPRTTKDGFLATNSILAIAASWVVAAGFDLPATLPLLFDELPAWPTSATRAMVLFTPSTVAAAYDLEARFSETGLLDVQLADLRNLAHGRHVGLLSKASSTVVIALCDPESKPLLEKTLEALPDSLQTISLSTDISGPAGTLDLLVGCMRLTGKVAIAYGSDPGRPKVSAVGRHLYHLPWSRMAAGPDGSRPARAKARAAGTVARGADLDLWTDAQAQWLNGVRGRRIRAIVMDYDGTVVPTKHRTLPPSAPVQVEVMRLLDSGVAVAIASGRGPSVVEELRRWIPEDRWQRVTVGIYNGGLILPLTDMPQRGLSADGTLQAAATVLRDELVGSGWCVTARRYQITVERREPSGVDASRIVNSLLAAHFGDQLKVVKSGHSVDVIPRATSKRAVVDRLGVDLSEAVLIGDQGDVDGNDFELLSHGDLSLSVDRVSADPTRCWNLSEDGSAGPELLARYLQAVHTGGSEARFAWKSGRSRG